jgi:hypothetical protein
MADEKVQPKRLTMTNTKKQMIEAYNALLKQLEEKRASELKPEKKLEEKKTREVVETAKALSTEGVVKGINNLKIEINTALAQISDKLEAEVNKFQSIQKAIKSKEQEFQEVYEIERRAATLAALIETQNQKQTEFESEMASRKEELDIEIKGIRIAWEKEKKDHEAQIIDRDSEEKKRRGREKEEFSYGFRREQQLAKDKFEDEKAKLEKELQLKKEQMEKELTEREKAISQRENELQELQKKVGEFPGEMKAAVNAAAKEATEKTKAEAGNRLELLKKEFDGERNVLNTRIASLEKTLEQQNAQLIKLSQQLEMAYQKVQDIALKAVEGSATVKSVSGLQQLMSEQTRKPTQEK